MFATCGKCKRHHATIEAVKACYAGELFTCDWLVERHLQVDEYEWDPEPTILPCGAEAWSTPTGHTCASGHEHVNLESQARLGLAYSDDRDEALVLAAAGVTALQPDGHTWLF